jgi:hypothetical protein
LAAQGFEEGERIEDDEENFDEALAAKIRHYRLMR